MQFNTIQRVKKFNSYKNKKNIKNILNEHHRELNKYANDVNLNLSTLNHTFKNFDENKYNEILENTSKFANNSKDVSFFYLSIVPNEFEHITGINVSYLLTKDEWKQLYQNQLEIIEKNIPNSMIMSSVLHMDENTPHMQLMLLHREEKNNLSSTEEQEVDMQKINNAMKKQFSRLNAKNEKLEPKSKEYKHSLEKFKEENLEKYIEKEKKRKSKKQNEEKEKKYTYTPSKNFFNQENSFEKLNEIVFNELKENSILKKLQTNMAKLSQEIAEFVPKRDETIESKAKDIKTLKKEFKQEIENLKNKLQIGAISKTEENKLINIAIKEKMIEEKKNISLNQYLENEKKYSNTEYLKSVRVDRKEIINNLLNENKNLKEENLKIRENTRQIKENLKTEEEKLIKIKNSIANNKIATNNLNLIKDLKSKKKKNWFLGNYYDESSVENALNLLKNQNYEVKAYQDTIKQLKSENKALKENYAVLENENLKKDKEISKLKQKANQFNFILEYTKKTLPQIFKFLDYALSITEKINSWNKKSYEMDLNKFLGIKNDEKEIDLER